MIPKRIKVVRSPDALGVLDRPPGADRLVVDCRPAPLPIVWFVWVTFRMRTTFLWGMLK